MENRVKFVLYVVFSMLIHTCLSAEICEIPSLDPPVIERIQNRTFPSIGLPNGRVIDLNTKEWLWSVSREAYAEEATKYDIHYYDYDLEVWWEPRPKEPYPGLVTRLHIYDKEQEMSAYQGYIRRNPNRLSLPEIRLHNHVELDAFGKDSDFWLRDADGEIIKNNVPWDEYTIDILNIEVQQLLIDRVVGLAECGLFDGVLFDAFAPYHEWMYNTYFNIEPEVVRSAYITILKGIRSRVRDDFLILVNRNLHKSPRYAAWINGSYMETNFDRIEDFTRERFREIEAVLLWNEEHLREPRINVLQGGSMKDQPFDSHENQRWMRFFTTLSLTHSDGYVAFGVSEIVNGNTEDVHIWYDFWDADLGRPVDGNETKGQTYNGIEGLFIREFTNGWAVYNRSGQAQTVNLLAETIGVASGHRGTQHTIPDLDGEIYLKSTVNVADFNGDGIVNILDLVIVANAFGKTEPDLNGDGVVNILDLVIVANAFE